MTEGIYSEIVERDSTTGDRGSSEISSALWNGDESRNILRLLTSRPRPDANPVEGDTLIIPPIAGYSDAAPLIRIRHPSIAPPVAAERTLDVDASPIDVGPLLDRGVRYSTSALRGNGLNQVDMDHLGVVRGFAFQDANGERRTIAANRFLRLMAGEPVDGWTSRRAGSGADATTVVTAPDGLTTYHIDSRGRLMSDAGSVRANPPRGVVAVDLGDGTRYDSAGTAGEVRSARTNQFGELMALTIRSATGSRSLTPQDWLAVARSGQPMDLGDGWSAERGNFGGRTPEGSVRIEHRDGTAYVVSPDGLLVHVGSPPGSHPYDTPRLEPRVPATNSSVLMGPLGDPATRYQTPDRRNMGANALDVDHLGIVRGLAHIGANGARRPLNLTLLDRMQLDSRLQPLPGGWHASRTGSGSDTVTTIVAPDGRTTYHLDARGRIIPGLGSVDVTAGPNMVAVDIGHGHSRLESVMADGTVASARVTPDGALSHITLRGRTVTTTITRTQWEAALHGPLADGNIGNGWSIHLIAPNHTGGRFPHGTAMIMHTDGTAYFVTPTGRLEGRLAAFPSRASRRGR